jgi:hypothetical protein
MTQKGYTPEQITNKLSDAEAHINQGVPIAEAMDNAILKKAAEGSF